MPQKYENAGAPVGFERAAFCSNQNAAPAAAVFPTTTFDIAVRAKAVTIKFTGSMLTL
jgi:hypothetical protein